MITLASHARVYLATGATDMRKAIDGLSILAQEAEVPGDRHSARLAAP